jgi:starch synthase
LRVALLTREYPPEVYGGAGVHVEYLARELARLEDVTVHCWGDDRPGADPPAAGYRPWAELQGPEPHRAALQAMSIDLAMAAGVEGAEIVHSHTWYANLAGHLSSLVYGIPHVATVHSLEPLRPWKAEQLGGGYALSSFCERTALEAADAIVAVSEGMRRDLLASYPAIDPQRVEVIYNGVDTEEYTPDPGTEVLERYGIDPELPSVVFVGRITRQKGVPYLLEAALEFEPRAQLVLCAGAPDTPEIGAEVERLVERLRSERGNVIWLDRMLPKREVIQLLSHATVFVCPSIYEPLGIVNLEAMACEAAVVATATGGIVEVVEDGVTGLLVPFEPLPDGSQEPRDRDGFVTGISARVNELLRDPGRAQALGRAGRQRAVEQFAWPAIAEQTARLYRSVARPQKASDGNAPAA